MTLPSRQSGRYESQSSSRESSRRLAADYNLEHAPLQSGEVHEDSKGLGLLRDLAAGVFAGGRFSAGIFVIFLLIIMAIVFRMTAQTLFNDLGQLERRDPQRSAAEVPSYQTNLKVIKEQPNEKSATQSEASGKSKSSKTKTP